MKILHITPHLGGGVGNVLVSWIKTDRLDSDNEHTVASLQYINTNAQKQLDDAGIKSFGTCLAAEIHYLVEQSDVVVVHWWDHFMMDMLLKKPWPQCRLAFWCHKNCLIPVKVKNYPDVFIATSPVIGEEFDCIWSVGQMERFYNISPVPHDGYVVGYVGTINYKKLRKNFIELCSGIREQVPEARFLLVGEVEIPLPNDSMFIRAGKVDDVAPYYAQMDVFGYPLQDNHYGTAEQVLGEAMASGLVPVCCDNRSERLIIKEGVTGFLCKTPQEYIDNVVHLYHKKQLREFMGNNARQAATEIYNAAGMVSKWNLVLMKLMKLPKRAHR